MALAFATCSAMPASSSASSSTGLVISCKHMLLQTFNVHQAHPETSWPMTASEGDTLLDIGCKRCMGGPARC